jgi:ATP-dependent helicase HrpB
MQKVEMTDPAPLPIDDVLPQVKAALLARSNAVLVAQPAAGKTTRVPLSLLNAPWLGQQKIIMLEPRRIAARAAAHYMAQLLKEEVGQTVGYSVRFDSRVSRATRIEIVTEGLFIHRLKGDPALETAGLIIFDEFHERNLEADLGLALALEAQEAFKPGLRILVMSATIEAQPVARLLGDAPVIAAAGKLYPVETRYLDRTTRQSVALDVADAARVALGRHQGSILAFLPGEAEIRRAEQALQRLALDSAIDILPLYGSLDIREQARAIAPSPPHRRKIVLATTIAETSLTIEGVGIVIDGGFKRVPRFDPGSGMTKLETVRVSASAAEQRRGRAGRMGPGVHYRLWPEEENRSLQAHDTPEILQADLAPFVLELASWGIGDPSGLRLLQRPPAGALAQARDVLRLLKAVDASGQITEHGKRMATLPLHPRLAHMVIEGGKIGQGWLAANIAALLQERDFLGGKDDASLGSRLELMRKNDPSCARVRLAAKQIRGLAKIGETETEGDAGGLLALAYADRIAKARDKRGSFRLANGGGAVLSETDRLAGEKFLAVATTDGHAANARIFLAAPISLAIIERQFGDRIETVQSVSWDRETQSVSAREERRFGALVLAERKLKDADPGQVAAALIEGIRDIGLQCLPWSEGARSLLLRVKAMRRLEPSQGWPEMSDETLAATLEGWLSPYLPGKTRRQHLAGIDLAKALRSLVPGQLLQRLDKLLPERLKLASGSSVPIDYEGDTPVLRVKLQELFGEKLLPALAEGRMPIRAELLSPAGRPVAVTQDLESFWRKSYAEVRAQMRGRYPKHDWPEDPLTASPSRGRTRR